MVLNLKQLYRIAGERVEIKYQIEQDVLKEYNGYAFVSPVLVEGEAFNRTGIVYLNYSVSFRLCHNCDRCLKGFNRDYSFQFKHIVIKDAEKADDDEYVLSDGDKLDLDELVISDLLLQLPSKMLCKEDCKGLCGICGADLNVSECNCKRD